MQPLHLVIDLGARRLEGHFDFEHFVDFLQGKPDGDFMAAACILQRMVIVFPMVIQFLKLASRLSVFHQMALQRCRRSLRHDNAGILSDVAVAAVEDHDLVLLRTSEELFARTF